MAATLGLGLLAASAALRAETAEPSAKRGGETFAIYCAACHGEGAAGGFGPALTDLPARKDQRPVTEIIRKPSPSMPPLYPATINDADVADIEAYLLSIQGERG
jgi:mono/diheme cytochrome c family protein